MTASAAALVSFVESSDLLGELAGVDISASQVERAAEALGAEIAVDEHHCVEPTGDVAPTMYLGMDGAGVPMRKSEVAGRAGKQPDGSAKTREAKVVTAWTAESQDDQGKPMRDPGSVASSAAIESAAAGDASPDRSDFAERVLREATRRSFTKASRCVVLGDGSAWIWNTAKELFPQAIQILDRYHVKETLHRTAQAIFGATSPEAKRWAMARCAELDDGKLSAIVHALRPHIRASHEVTKCATYIFAIALGCATRSFTLRVCALPPCTGGRLQNSHWDAAQADRHALDHFWRQRYHRPTLFQTQWSIRRFLGTPGTAVGSRRLISPLNSGVHPVRRTRPVSSPSRPKLRLRHG